MSNWTSLRGVGVGRGEILPFASYYLTGFLKDKPLAKLRNDMKEIGIELAENVKEPEDHIWAQLFRDHYHLLWKLSCYYF